MLGVLSARVCVSAGEGFAAAAGTLGFRVSVLGRLGSVRGCPVSVRARSRRP